MPAAGSAAAAALNAAQAINAFYAQLLEKVRSAAQAALSPATVRRVHATLHRALKDAVQAGSALQTNPVDARRPAESSARTAKSCRPGTQSSWQAFSAQRDRSERLYRPLAFTGDDRLPTG